MGSVARAAPVLGLEAMRTDHGVDGTKRIAFVTVPLSGHQRVATSLAAEMAKRGFLVDYIVGAEGITEELRELAQGMPHFSLHPIAGSLFRKVDWEHVASSSGRLGGSKLALFEQIAENSKDLSDAKEHWRAMIGVMAACAPDVAVFDHSQKVPQQWAESQGIPTVILHTPYFQTGPPTGCAATSPEDVRKLEELLAAEDPFGRMDAAMKELGVEGRKLELGEGEEEVRAPEGLAPHTLVFCEPELLHVPHLPPRVHAVGPCLPEVASKGVGAELKPWLDEALSASEKVLYVAFGTLANGFLSAAAAGTLLQAFDALGKGWRVLWSLPEAQHPVLAQAGVPQGLQQRLRVETFVPQRAVLEHPAVRLFLTHGGQTSVNEGLVSGRPLVCLPLFCDQYEMAEAVRRHGLGLVFHKDEALAGRAGHLCELLRHVDEAPSFRGLARRYGRLMRARGGAARAAVLLESIAYAGPDFGELWQGTPDPEEEVEEAAQAATPARPLPQHRAALDRKKSSLDTELVEPVH